MTESRLKKYAAHSKNVYVPTEREQERVKALLLRAYTDLARVCEDNALTLMLGGGSALGAVRNKGFIPWDDDMDLMMPREDYEKLKLIFDSALGDKYIMEAPNAPGHDVTYLFMKIAIRNTKRQEIQSLGAPGANALALDVFPLDYAPERAALRYIKGAFIDVLSALSVSNLLFKYRNPRVRALLGQTLSGKLNYMLRMALGILTAPIDYRSMYNYFDRVTRGKKPTGYVTVPTGVKHYRGEMHAARVYAPVSYGVFEGESAKLPGDAHEYLTRRYGDYMTPPPPSARERHAYISLELGDNNTSMKDGANTYDR